MQTVSSTYTSILANGGWHECKLEINGTAYDMEKIVSMRTSAALWDGAVSVGNTIAGTIDVSLMAPSSAVPTMAQLRPYVRATNGTESSEWLPRGVYYIDTREYDKETGILTLAGMDAMLKGEQDYMTTGDQGTWPQVDVNVLCDIADRLDLGSDVYTAVASPTGNPSRKGYYYKSGSDYFLSSDTSVQSGVTYYRRSNTGIDTRTWSVMSWLYSVGYPGIGEGAYTVRETLGFIGAMYGGNWILNEQGQLRLIQLFSIPDETNYLITQDGEIITLGGDRLVVE